MYHYIALFVLGCSLTTAFSLQRQSAKDQDQEQGATDEQKNAPLADITNENGKGAPKQGDKRRGRVQRQRGPPEDGVPSKTKVMVANIPYDLTEEKVS